MTTVRIRLPFTLYLRLQIFAASRDTSVATIGRELFVALAEEYNEETRRLLPRRPGKDFKSIQLNKGSKLLSSKVEHERLFKQAFNKVVKKYDSTFRSLANRGS